MENAREIRSLLRDCAVLLAVTGGGLQLVSLLKDLLSRKRTELNLRAHLIAAIQRGAGMAAVLLTNALMAAALLRLRRGQSGSIWLKALLGGAASTCSQLVLPSGLPLVLASLLATRSTASLLVRLVPSLATLPVQVQWYLPAVLMNFQLWAR